MAEVFPIISTSFDSNVYLILDEKVALIDTGAGVNKRIKEKTHEKLGNRKVDIIINTHAHVDHVGGNDFFNNASVYCHEFEEEEMKSGTFYGTSQFLGQASPKRVDHLLKNGDKIDLGETKLEVVHTPGHSPGCICLYEKDQRYLFSGDTLFTDGNVGRTDLIGGSMEDLVASLKKLKTLEFETLFPGHMRIVENAKEHLDMALFYVGNF
ncbi:MAG: MBL fold metallo-hydrolase [Candidatus Hydrothermarchaeales archaeon]